MYHHVFAYLEMVHFVVMVSIGSLAWVIVLNRWQTILLSKDDFIGLKSFVLQFSVIILFGLSPEWTRSGASFGRCGMCPTTLVVRWRPWWWVWEPMPVGVAASWWQVRHLSWGFYWEVFNLDESTGCFSMPGRFYRDFTSPTAPGFSAAAVSFLVFLLVHDSPKSAANSKKKAKAKVIEPEPVPEDQLSTSFYLVWDTCEKHRCKNGWDIWADDSWNWYNLLI